MNNWDQYKRMQCNIQKSVYNPDVSKMMDQHYQHLHKDLVSNPMDEDIFNDTYLKITYKYNPDKEFTEQFKWLFKQLKGAYYRDSKANHFYQLDENRLDIPDFIPDKSTAQDTGIVDRIKALINSPMV